MALVWFLNIVWGVSYDPFNDPFNCYVYYCRNSLGASGRVGQKNVAGVKFSFHVGSSIMHDKELP